MSEPERRCWTWERPARRRGVHFTDAERNAVLEFVATNLAADRTQVELAVLAGARGVSLSPRSWESISAAIEGIDFNPEYLGRHDPQGPLCGFCSLIYRTEVFFPCGTLRSWMSMHWAERDGYDAQLWSPKIVQTSFTAYDGEPRPPDAVEITREYLDARRAELRERQEHRAPEFRGDDHL